MSEAKARELLRELVEAENACGDGPPLDHEIERAERAWQAARAYLAAVPAPPAEPTREMADDARRYRWLKTRVQYEVKPGNGSNWIAEFELWPGEEFMSDRADGEESLDDVIDADIALRDMTQAYIEPNAAPAAEPVAQQPPPRSRFGYAPDHPLREEMEANAAAPQPEAPTLADDLVARCNAEAERLWRGFGKFKGPTAGDIRAHDILREAAARIESDAKRIRELEADVYNAVWNLGGCDSLASGWTKPDEPIDESMARPALLSVRKMAAELAASRERERALREALRLVLPMAKGYAAEHPVGNNVAMVAEAESAIATPDSAASPTGGEG